MYEKKLSDLVRAAQNNEITFQKAVDETLVIIYKQKRRFRLGNFTPDEQSSLLLFIYERLESVLRKYKENTSPFIVYLYRSIEIIKYSWIKIKQRKLYYENCISPVMINKYYEKEYFNSFNETTVKLLETENKEWQYKTQYKICNGNSKLRSRSLKKAILVLTLKSCYFIEKTDIQRVAELCNYNEEDLEKSIDELKKTLAKKAEALNLYKSRRDRSYFYHLKYANELKEVEENSIVYDKVFQKYKKHSQHWEKETLKLRNNMHIAPKNSDIAKVLGICERQVGYYIAYAKKFAE